MILIVTQSVVINSKFWFKALPIKIPEIIQPPIIQPSVQKMQIQCGYLTFISKYRQFWILNKNFHVSKAHHTESGREFDLF